MKWSYGVLAYISAHPYLSRWPDARTVLDGFDAQLRISLPTALPVWTCYAAGGSPEQALPLGASFTLLHMAASVLDDFQDQDTNHPWTAWGQDRILASTLAMVFLSQSCLARLDADAASKREILDGFAEAYLLASVGQGRAISPEQPVSSYWRHALAKSSLGFAVAAWSGTRLATDDPALAQAAREYGMALGTLLQVADDFHDFVNASAAPSPSALMASLPVVIAQEERDHPARGRLEQLLSQANTTQDSAWAGDVCDVVIEMGGLSQTAGIAKVYEHKALAALAAFNTERTGELTSYVQSILATDTV
jgi:geranylgeranyl pyrophosphate synthase